MAFFQYLCKADEESLLQSFKSRLQSVNLEVSNKFSSHAEIYAESVDSDLNSYSKVKVIISWINKKDRCCEIEIRSDEPSLKRNTHCERITTQLKNIIPPHHNIPEESKLGPISE
tara:strand:+ start:104 stop:448 length:345 start_codon:yes stop_codon:yes gene_type:complete